MAITINSIFKKFSGARNPMPLVLETDNYVDTAGTAQVLNVADNTPRTAGQTMTLRIGDEQCVITYSATPDLKLNEVRPYVDATSFANFLSDLNSLVFISRYFTVSGTWGAAPQHVIFTQNTADETHQISVVSWTAATWVNTAATDVAYKDNFRMVVDVYKQALRAGVAEVGAFVGSMDMIPDADGVATVDVAKVLRGALVPDAPLTTAAGSAACENMFSSIWLQYYEKYGVPAVAYNAIRLGEPDDYYGVVRGGMRWESWDADTVNDDYFEAAQNKFLTNMPDAMPVADTQPLWLNFYNNATRSIRVLVTAHFTDNTTDQFTVYPGAVNDGVVMRYAVGYTQLNIEGNVTIPTGHRVSYYTVQVETNTGTQVSEQRRFDLDWNSGGRNYLVFENRWGAFDTVLCRGWFGTGVTAEGNDAMGIDDPQYAVNEGPMGTYGTRGRDTYVWDTGYKRATELEWLRELAESDYTYFVEGSNLIRCVVDRGAFASLYGTILPPNGITIGFMRANFS